MRLIDADELKKWSEEIEYTFDGGIDINEFDRKLEHMSTVEAIPVKWLFERVPKIDQVMKLYNTKLIEYIVIMWREENEVD